MDGGTRRRPHQGRDRGKRLPELGTHEVARQSDGQRGDGAHRLRLHPQLHQFQGREGVEPQAHCARPLRRAPAGRLQPAVEPPSEERPPPNPNLLRPAHVRHHGPRPHRYHSRPTVALLQRPQNLLPEAHSGTRSQRQAPQAHRRERPP